MKWFAIMAFVAVAAVLLTNDAAWADRLQAAIDEAISTGAIEASAEPGYLGIPGAVPINLLIGGVWAIFVGWVFSTVGAFGGILAGVGHISIYGLGDYAKSFDKSLKVNKVVTDSIRVSNQWLVGTSAAMGSYNYYKMGRLVLPLGLSLGAGAVTGSILVPILSAGKINLSSYLGYFGLFVFLLGAYLIYELTPAGQAGKKAATAAAKAFQESVKSGTDSAEQGVKVISFAPTKCEFTFYGVEFSFNPIIPVVGGFFIAGLASFLGVGGGFLLVPFLTSVAGLPMYLVAGTSATAVLIGMISSIFSYMVIKGTPVQWSLIGVELIGIVVGSTIGPKTSKFIPEKGLKVFFILLAIYVGFRYCNKGFGLGFPPYIFF